tara:strand:+ start:86 stop:463 length:378 start_codon:yes stop_codon:yes gene_type:complete
MQHLIENISYLQDKYLMKGFVFGFVHVLIMLLGFYTGWSINRFLKIISNGFIAGIVGVIIAHAFADLIAALIDTSVREHALGIFLGGLVVLPLIPLFEKYIIKSKYHIAIGDHDEIKKDLKKKHK